MNAYVAAYSDVNGLAMAAAAEEVSTMHPGRFAETIFCSAKCAIETADTALHSRLASCASRGVDSKNPVSMYPAFRKKSCTSMSEVASLILER